MSSISNSMLEFKVIHTLAWDLSCVSIGLGETFVVENLVFEDFTLSTGLMCLVNSHSMETFSRESKQSMVDSLAAVTLEHFLRPPMALMRKLALLMLALDRSVSRYFKVEPTDVDVNERPVVLDHVLVDLGVQLTAIFGILGVLLKQLSKGGLLNTDESSQVSQVFVKLGKLGGNDINDSVVLIDGFNQLFDVKDSSLELTHLGCQEQVHRVDLFNERVIKILLHLLSRMFACGNSNFELQFIVIDVVTSPFRNTLGA
ncbi:hypothetical protein WICPIJ_004635 [Wickerhamomyces pijperi]|uniref:Uncharacterized protein n=1 Tax=Wickerhamomyces pijperi TaxID=599730 RepID=A0A9P8TMQ5_WICPI|nr:hypothetical protein WICPIJ_004635 [Wickerhamomyces pijperi]